MLPVKKKTTVVNVAFVLLPMANASVKSVLKQLVSKAAVHHRNFHIKTCIGSRLRKHPLCYAIFADLNKTGLSSALAISCPIYIKRFKKTRPSLKYAACFEVLGTVLKS